MNEKDYLLAGYALSKKYIREEQQLQVLNEVDVEVGEGEMLCIQGESGAGKSTLLQILGTLDRPSSGSLFFNDGIINVMLYLGGVNLKVGPSPTHTHLFCFGPTTEKYEF